MATTTAFSPEEERAILSVLSEFPARDQLIIVAALRTGFRVSELLSLRIGDVWAGNAPRSSITIERRHLKGGRGPHCRNVRSRTVPVTGTVRDALAAYVAPRVACGASPDAPLFLSRSKGGALSRWQANAILARVLERAGIAADRCHGMHSCRKTLARSLYQRTGHDLRLVQRVLGHRYSSTTESYLAIADGEAFSALLALG